MYTFINLPPVGERSEYYDDQLIKKYQKTVLKYFYGQISITSFTSNKMLISAM